MLKPAHQWRGRDTYRMKSHQNASVINPNEHQSSNELSHPPDEITRQRYTWFLKLMMIYDTGRKKGFPSVGKEIPSICDVED